MKKAKVYIDGQSGTTGLEIIKRLLDRKDIELLLISEALRHDPKERKNYMDQADLVFLCLPDTASKEAVQMIDEKTKVIDASTAHRTHPDWVYGFPELSKYQKEAIKKSNRVANPGCHATGFISIVYPLIQKEVLSKKDIISCTSLTGYSGGGKSMIEQYEQHKTQDLFAPRVYGVQMHHKHLKEMKTICQLEKEPLFCPIVDDYYRGMLTTVMVHQGADEIFALYKEFYASSMISVHRIEDGFVSANALANQDGLQILVSGHQQQTMISARFDNLGKGACGAAIQNMNLMLGCPEYEGLQQEGA